MHWLFLCAGRKAATEPRLSVPSSDEVAATRIHRLDRSVASETVPETSYILNRFHPVTKEQYDSLRKRIASRRRSTIRCDRYRPVKKVFKHSESRCNNPKGKRLLLNQSTFSGDFWNVFFRCRRLLIDFFKLRPGSGYILYIIPCVIRQIHDSR